MIDTENKRRSTLGIWGFMRCLPAPANGSIDEADRRHLWGYRFADDAGGVVSIVAQAMQNLSMSLSMRM